MNWSIDKIQDPLYRTKFVEVPDIIAEWLCDSGGLYKKDVLEFGCGEGTMALGTALRKEAQRVVGVEVLDVFDQCLPLAKQQIGLEALPDNLHLQKIAPGSDITEWGQFDVIYSWSVFEHVSQAFLPRALETIKAALKPDGFFFLQVTPLYYSSNGSHFAPWIPEPWAHLSMQHDVFRERFFNAPETSAKVRNEWTVYLPANADTPTERAVLWDMYLTLNKVTAPQLCRLACEAGFKIVRDYRTTCDQPVPQHLSEVYSEEVLKTEQIVLLMQHA